MRFNAGKMNFNLNEMSSFTGRFPLQLADRVLPLSDVFL